MPVSIYRRTFHKLPGAFKIKVIQSNYVGRSNIIGGKLLESVNFICVLSEKSQLEVYIRALHFLQKR